MAYAEPADLAFALHRQAFTADEAPHAERCINAATVEIDKCIGASSPVDDWTEPELALVSSVCLLRAVEWWKANDAAFGLIGSAELGALRAPRDGFARHALTLSPLRRSWGIW